MPRLRAVWASLLATAALLTGCVPPPVPAEPFGEFTVTESGGIDGRFNPLLVRPDGVALLMSNDPASGTIPAADLERVRVLLTSVEFRRETAASDRRSDQDPCADDISWTVTMGDLTVNDGGSCAGDDVRTPATDEIVGLLAEEVRGTFTAGVPAGEPELVPLTLDRQATRYYPAATFEATATGQVTMLTAHGVERTRQLDQADRDTLRLLLGRQASRPANRCQHPGPYRLEIGGNRTVTVTYCLGDASPRELLATILLVQNQFER